MLASTRDVIRLLESGKNVVTPVGWIYPAESPGVAAIEAACQKAGVTLHGTGINPGGITERFPLMLSALCRDIRHVRAEEFSDIRNYPTEMVVRDVMLFGKHPEAAQTSPMLECSAHGFCSRSTWSPPSSASTLDAEKRTTHEMAVATQPLDTPVGVHRDRARSPRSGSRGKAPSTASRSITVRVNWLMGEEHLDPPWTFGGAALRGRVRRRPAARGHVPRPAPAGDRRARRDRSHRARDALRERDPVRLRRRARDQDLPRPAAARGPRIDRQVVTVHGDDARRRGGELALTHLEPATVAGPHCDGP